MRAPEPTALVVVVVDDDDDDDDEGDKTRGGESVRAPPLDVTALARRGAAATSSATAAAGSLGASTITAVAVVAVVAAVVVAAVPIGGVGAETVAGALLATTRANAVANSIGVALGEGVATAPVGEWR